MKSHISIEMNSHPAVGAVEKLQAMLDLYLSQCYGVRDYSINVQVEDS